MIIRQYTKKGDPCLSIKLPATLIAALKQEAAENKRPYQDELALRLHATFKRNIEYRTRASMVINQIKEDDNYAPYRQQISQDIMNLLIKASKIDNHSLAEEVCFRLKISFMEAQAMGTNQLYTKLVRHKLTQKTIAAQNVIMKFGKRYVFELQQLELNIRNESWIPKEMLFKSFECIDVKEQTKQIRKKITTERQDMMKEERTYGFLCR